MDVSKVLADARSDIGALENLSAEEYEVKLQRILYYLFYEGFNYGFSEGHEQGKEK